MTNLSKEMVEETLLFFDTDPLLYWLIKRHKAAGKEGVIADYLDEPNYIDEALSKAPELISGELFALFDTCFKTPEGYVKSIYAALSKVSKGFDNPTQGYYISIKTGDQTHVTGKTLLSKAFQNDTNNRYHYHTKFSINNGKSIKCYASTKFSCLSELGKMLFQRGRHATDSRIEVELIDSPEPY